MATSNQGKDQDNKGNQGASQGSGKQGAAQGSSKQSDTSNRGFASMDPERQREIAAEGGRAAHEKGTAHEFTSEEARRAGSMSHKNDQGSRQSSTGGSTGGSTGEAGSRGGTQGGNEGSSGGSGKR